MNAQREHKKILGTISCMVTTNYTTNEVVLYSEMVKM